MKKLIVILSVVITTALVHPVQAQFSGGLELGAPLGTFGDYAKIGFGASVRYQASINDQLAWTASIGYLSFGGKDVPVGSQTASLGSHSNVPITGGVQYYLGEGDNKFYISGDISINFISVSVLYPNSGNGGGYNIASASETRIGFAPGVGYRFGNWDFGAKFNLISDFNYAGLRIGYVFGTK